MNGTSPNSAAGFDALAEDVRHLWDIVRDWHGMLDLVDCDDAAKLTIGRLAEMSPDGYGATIEELARVASFERYTELRESLQRYEYPLDVAYRSLPERAEVEHDYLSWHEAAFQEGYRRLYDSLRPFLKPQLAKVKGRKSAGVLPVAILKPETISAALLAIEVDEIRSGIQELDDRSEWQDFYSVFTRMLRAERNRVLDLTGVNSLDASPVHDSDGKHKRGRDFAAKMFESGELDEDIEKIKQRLKDFVAILRSDELAEFYRQWEVEFEERYPHDIDAWTRLAARAGVSGEFLLKESWKGGDVMPIIEGYLQRLLDKREMQNRPITESSGIVGENGNEHTTPRIAVDRHEQQIIDAIRNSDKRHKTDGILGLLNEPSLGLTKQRLARLTSSGLLVNFRKDPDDNRGPGYGLPEWGLPPNHQSKAK